MIVEFGCLEVISLSAYLMFPSLRRFFLIYQLLEWNGDRTFHTTPITSKLKLTLVFH